MDGEWLALHIPVFQRELPYLLYIIARSTGQGLFPAISCISSIPGGQMCDAIPLRLNRPKTRGPLGPNPLRIRPKTGSYKFIRTKKGRESRPFFLSECRPQAGFVWSRYHSGLAFSPRLSSNGSILGSAPRKARYMVMASAEPPRDSTIWRR